MKRRSFVQKAGLLTAALMSGKLASFASEPEYPVVRRALAQRRFSSRAVENTIAEFSSKVKNKELAWLFNNCFPNALDTSVIYTEPEGKPDTYVNTGDMDAMWMRDSTTQVWSYLPLLRKDKALKEMVAGVINRQVRNILKDPYANSFFNDPTKQSEWKDTKWQEAMKLILKTFREQQRKENDGPYHFQRSTAWASDNLPLQGYGYPVAPVGLICSSFRPSEDATLFSFLVPSNFFAVVSLKQAAELFRVIKADEQVAADMEALALEVRTALQKHAVIEHEKFGKVYAYEVNGMGSYHLMDDANIPSLLALPYLGAISMVDPVYLNTRKMVLSTSNPFYFKGQIAEGIGGPHIGKNMIWPMSIIARALTSADDEEIKLCLDALLKSHAGTGFMHESFHADNPKQYTRAEFAWANTFFGELLWKLYQEKPHLLA
jgi:meiotically up-regulated gene 157 (Mug157) protein